jgi:hypothetical protein
MKKGANAQNYNISEKTGAGEGQRKQMKTILKSIFWYQLLRKN